MRALFAQLPDDGRLAVHLAYQNTHPSPQAGAFSLETSWTVVLRDNARVLFPGTDIRCLYAVTDSPDFALLRETPVIAGLCGLDDTIDPACRFTWAEVLRLLDVLATRFPAWQITAIVGTQEPEPRYGVTLQTETGAPRPLPSYGAFDRLCLEAGPLAPRPLPMESVPVVARAPDLAAAAAPPTSRRQPVTALVFATARQPQACTLGGLDWLAPAGVATWIDLCAPDRDDVLAVARQLRLPYQAALATLAPASEVWCRAYQDHIALRLPVARRDSLGGHIAADALDLIVGPDVVVSVHDTVFPALVRARRRVNRGPDHGSTTVFVLFAAILDEVFCSEEALARWLLQESAVRPRHPEDGSGPRHVRQAAAELCRLVERRQELLAAADRIGRHLHGLALIPWWREMEDRRGRLLAQLRQAEELAPQSLHHPAATMSDRGSRGGHVAMAGVAALLGGFIALAVLHLLRQTLALVAVVAVLLVAAIMVREHLRERCRTMGATMKR
jgi:hypothetical protein